MSRRAVPAPNPANYSCVALDRRTATPCIHGINLLMQSSGWADCPKDSPPCIHGINLLMQSSGWADLNRRPLVPQTSTLTPALQPDSRVGDLTLAMAVADVKVPLYPVDDVLPRT